MSLRYFDTGLGGPNESLGFWLNENLIPGTLAFRAQYGYFGIEAIRPYLPVLQNIAHEGGPLRLVIGANNGNPLGTDELDELLPIFAGGGDAKLAVINVGKRGYLFHPKVLHLTRGDGTDCAVVGSANMTKSGFGDNVEAGLIIESGKTTNDALEKVCKAIEHWFTCGDDGVHTVAGKADVQKLVEYGLAVSPDIRKKINRDDRAPTTKAGRGSRSPGWRPTKTPDKKTEATGADGKSEPTSKNTANRQTKAAAYWYKKLSPTDALQSSSLQRIIKRPRKKPTSPTHELRLTKSTFNIKPNQYFREDFFGNLEWEKEDRKGNLCEKAQVIFTVTKQGGQVQQYELSVEHATHRADHAHEPTTVIKWGQELSSWLRDNDQAGNWVLLYKDVDGHYWLSFHDNKPDMKS